MCGGNSFVCEDCVRVYPMTQLTICSTDGEWLCQDCYMAGHVIHDTIAEVELEDWELAELSEDAAVAEDEGEIYPASLLVSADPMDLIRVVFDQPEDSPALQDPHGYIDPRHSEG